MSLEPATPPRRSLLAGIVVAVLVSGCVSLWPPSSSAAASSTFGSFVGEWTGSGEVVGSNGDRERIRCRASYEESKQGVALSQTIVCASASYRIDIQSYVEASGPAIQGHWQEQTRAISGELTGTIAGGRFEGAVTGLGFSAQLSLRSDGRRQAVNILPNGGDIAEVRIELERRG